MIEKPADTQHGRYTLEGLIGKGGMGVVYRAVDQLEGRPVALKRFEVNADLIELNPLAASPRYQQMILAHEFKTLAALRHPNIISVLDYGFTPERQPYFVMELLEAPRTILTAAQTQPLAGKVDLLIQMLQAISYLHHHRILHRDLKPNNVLATQANEVKVLDFGLAVKAGEYQQTAGTIHYMAPEVIRHEQASEHSDLYAIGVMAYEMFVGARPFKGTLQNEITEQILNTPPDMAPLELLAADDPVLAQLSAIIACLLEKQPADRYPSALAVIRLLCAALGEPLPPDEGAIRESFLQAASFVGRERELEDLGWVLIRAKEGNGSAWLVGGESGIGKSRLLDELRINALTEDIVVLRGQIDERADSLAAGWAEIVQPLLLTIPISASEAHILQTILPDIGTLLGIALPDAPPAYDDDQVCATIADIVSRVRHPTLILLEDLHWATVSLEPLKRLLPLLPSLPILIVGSYRSDEAPELPAQMVGIQQMKLERLSTAAIATLSASMLGAAGSDPRLLELVDKETEGNVFFIVEVIRAWAEEAGHLSAVGQFALSEAVLTGGIQHIVQRRLNRVPDWAYGGLQVAAVAGRKLNLEVLDHILSPLFSLLPGENISASVSTVWREKRNLNLNDWLLLCANAGILEIQDGDWRFSHDKLREQILADLDAAQMRLLRTRVDKAFTALYGSTPRRP